VAADDLREYIALEDLEFKRSLISVCHSPGGIVVRG
jgi:hypothetical protein